MTEKAAHPVWGENLWVGRQPPTGRYLRSKGFHTVVLCAMEYQPHEQLFEGLRVIRCPIDDDKPTPGELALVKQTAISVANEVQRGHKTLVTCHMGLNRSALVAALAMVRLGCKPKAAIDIIRMFRGPHAFSNTWFEQIVVKYRPGLR